MWQGSFLVLASLLGADDVTVQPLQGNSARGSLISVSPESVVIRAGAEEMSWPINGLLSVKPVRGDSHPAAEDKSPTIRVECGDGSLIVGDELTLAAGKVTLRRDGVDLEFPSRVVHSIRLRRPNDSLQEQWNAISSAPVTGDQLVVRKTNQTDPNAGPATMALDQLEGVVRGITAAGVAFEYDGDRIDVAWEKVEGVVFHQGQEQTWPDPICRVRESQGSAWNVRSISFSEGMLQLQSVTGISTATPLTSVVELDFTAGNLVFLSDLTPESIEWRPYLVTPATPSALATWFSVRRDQRTDGSVLTLGGQSYEKGLAVHSRASISYRLTREFRRFQAMAGIDERFRGTANLKLVISGDERILLTRDVRGGDEPFAIDLDLTGIRRLRILVDFGDDRSDAGDHLLLCNARLTK